MATQSRSFKVTVLDKGFLVMIETAAVDPTGSTPPTIEYAAYENISRVGHAMWAFLAPYSTIPTVEGAIPAVME